MWNKLCLFYLMKMNRVQIDLKTVSIRGIPYIKNRGTLIIKKGVTINSCFKANPVGSQTFTSLVVMNGGILILEEGSGISNSSIYCVKSIRIGKNVFIGADCKIFDTDFHSLYLSERISGSDQGMKSAPIVIEDGVFIGAASIILKGVHIGRESIIGAGSVVTTNVPPFEVWAGNPAKFIKKLSSRD